MKSICNRLSFVAIGFVAAVVGTVVAQTTVSIQGIGDLPGGAISSDIRALSKDGTTVVGLSNVADGFEAIRWKNGVLQGLGDFEGGALGSVALSVSGDGNFIGGQGSTYSQFNYINPGFIWRPSTGLQQTPIGGNTGSVTCITPDGSIYGMSTSSVAWMSNIGWCGNSALQWGSSLKAMSANGLVCFGSLSYTVGCSSGNCTNVSGTRFTIDKFSGERAPSGPGPVCELCSSDGSVGLAYNSSGLFQWTTGGTVQLPHSEGFTPKAASDDLSIIVGNAYLDGATRAAVYTTAGGIQSVEKYLILKYGVVVNLDGRTITSCNGISANGLVFAGSGQSGANNSEGWILKITFDWNGNGIDDSQEIKDGLVSDVNNDGIADCYQSGSDCPVNVSTNPGFESGTVLADCTSETLTAGSNIAGWEVISGVCERARRSKNCSATSWVAEFGEYAIELKSVGGTPGTIREAMQVIPGHRYKISFWLSANCTDQGSPSIQVGAANSSASFIFNCVGNAQQSWKRCELEFVAVSEIEYVQFNSPNSPLYGPVIDSISVLDITVGCPWDLTGNGVTDSSDLGLMLLNFGPCQN